MRGKDINLTVQAGSEAVRLVRILKENGESWEAENIAARGKIWDMEMREELGEIECRVSGEGVIELKYPAMGLGRYIFAVDIQSDAGEWERLIEGYIGYEGPIMEVEGAEYGEDMVIMLGGETRKVLFGKNTAWEGLYKETQAAVEGAREAEAGAELARDGALSVLRSAQEFIDGFNEAVRRVIQIGGNGNWWIGGADTGVRVTGEDGKTPHIGNDGYWWIGEESTDVKAQGENGLTPYIGANGHWCIGAIDTGVLARGRDGVDGTVVRRILVGAYADIPWTGDTCNGGFYYYVPSGEEYEVYAWLEPEGWVKVGLANDLATKEVHGLVKLGTNSVVGEGAVVGNNINNELSVPAAGKAVYGAVKLGKEGQSLNGVGVGVNADNELVVGRGSSLEYGVVKVSSSAVLSDGGLTALNANGQVLVNWASTSAGGAVKVGAMGVSKNPLPYSDSAGVTDGKQLVSNFTYGGAIQSRKATSWGGQMSWLDAVIETNPDYFADQFYTGLLTTEQFTQSEAKGLELLGATTSRLAGVYIATGVDDVRSDAVPNASTVEQALEAFGDTIAEAYRTKADSYSTDEVDALVASAGGSTYTKAEIDSMFAGAHDDIYTKEESDARYIQDGTGNIKKMYTMYKSEFDQLVSREANAIYFVKKDV